MEVRDPHTLRRERKAKRYSQRELGLLTRRSQTAIYKLETGQLRYITEDFALALAARLDRRWDELFIVHEGDKAA